MTKDSSTGDTPDLAVASTLSDSDQARAFGKSGPRPGLSSKEFEIEGLIGSGGMGEVYKAWDPKLRRHVALKILRGASPELAAKLLREAQSQARVEHANVCRVYGVGEIDGHPFIALQYVEGRTLREVGRQLTLEERVTVMREVSLALHAAHRQGLVHRDVKPANVLMERGDDGVWKPYVADFGIAREVEAASQTMTGLASGTPLYMAPEQARGDNRAIDRRTDVYSLGATLFELCAGRPPFVGTSAAGLILALVHDEPPLLRRIEPTVPLDLETICMKCLEKDPSRRYESARALADDLQRYLDGEPIQARRKSVRDRLWKLLRKHLALAAASLLALVAVGIAAGVALAARRTAAAQALLAQQFGRTVEKIDALGRYAALLPRHDTRREQALIRGRMGEIATQMGTLGAVAQAPGHYALGRGHLQLRELGQAERELREAWGLGYRAPEVAYALGLTLGERYKDAIEEARLAEEQLRRARTEAAARLLRDPALELLRQSRSVEIDAPEYVEAMIALWERRFDDASRKAHQALERAPWMFEAQALEGDVRALSAADREAHNDPEGARAERLRAGEAYRAAIKIAPSYAPAYLGECRRIVDLSEASIERDRPVDALVGEGLAACAAALETTPESAQLGVLTAQLHYNAARYQSGHGVDPREEYARAATAAHRAAGWDADYVKAYYTQGSADRQLGAYRSENGEDPRAELDRARDAAERILQRRPDDPDGHMLAGMTANTRGDYEAAHGIDPSASYRDSIEHCEKALRVEPERYLARNDIGTAWFSLATWELSRGQDPRHSVERAMEVLGEVMRTQPTVDYGFINACGALQMQAEYEIVSDLDPRPTIDRSLMFCRRAIAIDPNYAGSHLNVGSGLLDRARYQFGAGRDPEPDLAAARTAIDEALHVDPRFVLAYRTLADARLLEARARLTANRPAEEALNASAAAIARALAVNPKDAEAWQLAATLHRVRAEALAKRRRPIAAELALGLTSVDSALAEHPLLGAAHAERGALYTLAAHHEQDPDKRAGLLHQARSAFFEALEQNPLLKHDYAAPIAEVAPLAPRPARLPDRRVGP